MFLKRLSILIIAVFISMLKVSYAEDHNLGIVYPDLREPYRSIFTSIIEGIEDTVEDKVFNLPVNKEVTEKMIATWAKRNKLDSIISLGSRSQKLTANIQVNRKIVGAINRPPANGNFQAGVLLTPDPHKLFESIIKLVPRINRIYMVYSEEYSGWYLDIARIAAKLNKIELITLSSSSIKESLQHYKEIVQKRVEGSDAIWLLQDPLSSDMKLIMPIILEKAWEKNIPVISNKAGHVERGALFALYPDNFEIGVSLAKLLKEDRTGESIKYLPFSKALTAANIRTADHLGLNWSKKVERSINLVFPSR